VYSAYNTARADVAGQPSYEPPLHLRNAPTKLMKELGYSEGYRYAHDEPDAYAAGEDYFPIELEPRRYYKPANRGLEQKIAQKLEHLRALDAGSTKKRRG
jgi:putative ATPase